MSRRSRWKGERKPEKLVSDQGSQFTSDDLVARLQSEAIKNS